MRREVSLLLSSLAILSCGARTGLGGELTLSSSDAEVDGSTDAPLEADAQVEADGPIDAARPHVCPPSPPMTGATCPPTTPSGTLCIYETPPTRMDWFCLAGGWVNETSKSGRVEPCFTVVCHANVSVECIESSPKQCCFCDAEGGTGGTVSLCGPC